MNRTISLFLLVFVISLSFSSAETYFYAGNNLVAVKDGQDDSLEYMYRDRLGGDTASYKLPFGQLLVEGGPLPFTGKELDDSGLYYFGARYYDADTARFTALDAVPDQPKYQYVANNPLKYIDPDGNDIHVFYDPVEWTPQAVSGAKVFAYYFNTDAVMHPVNTNQEFGSAWRGANMDVENDIALLFFHGENGVRIWFRGSNQGITTHDGVGQRTIGDRFGAGDYSLAPREDATYVTLDSLLGPVYNPFGGIIREAASMPACVVPMVCEGAKGVKTVDDGSISFSEDNWVTSFTSLGVPFILAGTKGLSYHIDAETGIYVPRTRTRDVLLSGSTAKNVPYPFTFFFKNQESGAIFGEDITSDFRSIYDKYIYDHSGFADSTSTADVGSNELKIGE